LVPNESPCWNLEHSELGRGRLSMVTSGELAFGRGLAGSAPRGRQRRPWETETPGGGGSLGRRSWAQIDAPAKLVDVVVFVEEGIGEDGTPGTMAPLPPRRLISRGQSWIGGACDGGTAAASPRQGGVDLRRRARSRGAEGGAGDGADWRRGGRGRHGAVGWGGGGGGAVREGRRAQRGSEPTVTTVDIPYPPFSGREWNQIILSK